MNGWMDGRTDGLSPGLPSSSSKVASAGTCSLRAQDSGSHEAGLTQILCALTACQVMQWPGALAWQPRSFSAQLASTEMLSTRPSASLWRHLPLFTCISRTMTDGTRAETTSSSTGEDITAPGLATETCKRSLWALPALRAWETPVPASLGYMLKAHSDMRPGRAGRSPVSQAAAQPRDSQPTASHQLGAALLQCVRLVQLLECRVQAGTWYKQVLSQAANQGGSTMYSTPPSPPEICWGPGKSRAPPPNSLCLPLLQPALSVSGLSWSWLSVWVWVWVLVLFFPHLPPPSPSPPSSPFSTVPARPHCQHFCFARLCSLLAVFQ